MEGIWGKRRFHGADHAPYHDRLAKPQLADASRYREFMMFLVEEEIGVADAYVGVPTQELMSVFDGFERVNEAALPMIVDTLLLADVSEFSKRFRFKNEIR